MSNKLKSLYSIKMIILGFIATIVGFSCSLSIFILGEIVGNNGNYRFNGYQRLYGFLPFFIGLFFLIVTLHNNRMRKMLLSDDLINYIDAVTIKHIEKISAYKIGFSFELENVYKNSQIVKLYRNYISDKNYIKQNIESGEKYKLIMNNNIACGYFSYLEEIDQIIITNLYIEKDFRLRGIGRKTLGYILNSLVNQRKLIFESLKISDSYYNFYMKFGFQKEYEYDKTMLETIKVLFVQYKRAE